jgi:hypothetical protein
VGHIGFQIIASMRRLFLAFMACSLPAFAGERVITTLTAPVKFDQRDTTTFLVIDDGKKKMDFAWSYALPEKQTALYPMKLEEKQTYIFTIEQEKSAAAPGVLINAQIMTVTRDGQTVYDRAVCEVHARRMERKEVPIVLGLPGKLPGEPSAEEEKAFPKWRESFAGGCIGIPGKNKELVFVCPDCKAAHAEWKANTKKDK